MKTYTCPALMLFFFVASFLAFAPFMLPNAAMAANQANTNALSSESNNEKQTESDPVFTQLSEIVSKPDAFAGKIVTVKAIFQGWHNAPGSPPVTRSDWVIQEPGGPSMYCTGLFPEKLHPDDPAAIGRQVIVLGQVQVSSTGMPYLQASEVTIVQPTVERMVSVAQILFDPLGMQGCTVGLLGVLAKGYNPRGNRIYLLADPTGAITLERLPKLYPKGTILRLRGIVGTDSDGLPIIKNVEIISAKP